MSTYVVGDIHGCLLEWIQLKNKIESEDKDAKFILVGDIIDRGPNTVDMVEWAMQNITNSGKYQMVIGNHEVLKINWWDSLYSNINVDRYDNTREVLINKCFIDDTYGYVKTFYNAEKGIKDLYRTIKWFKMLPYYKDITVNNQRYIIVHSNLPYSAIEDDNITIRKYLSKTTKDFIVWDRNTDSFDKIEDAILINGHTPTISSSAFDLSISVQDRVYGRILNMGNRYNVDCGIVFKGMRENANLAALRLEDLKEFYLFE